MLDIVLGGGFGGHDKRYSLVLNPRKGIEQELGEQPTKSFKPGFSEDKIACILHKANFVAAQPELWVPSALPRRKEEWVSLIDPDNFVDELTIKTKNVVFQQLISERLI